MREKVRLADTKRRRRRQRRITIRQARRALYVDLEGRGVEGEDPVLFGVLFDETPDAPARQWILKQFVFDPACARVADAASPWCDRSSIDAALRWLLGLSDSERRHVVSWSRHDRDRIRELTENRAFRYRNAIATAKRWREQQRIMGGIDDEGPNDLKRYEGFIGYQRPAERFSVGESIAYIRGLSGVTPGAAERWKCLVGHNFHDLYAMREVVWRAVGLCPEPEAEG